MRDAVRVLAVVGLASCLSAGLFAQQYRGNAARPTPPPPAPAIHPVFPAQRVVPPSASANSIGIPASAGSIGIPASAYAGGNVPRNVYGTSTVASPWAPVSQNGKRNYRGGYGYGYGLPFFPFLATTGSSFDDNSYYPPPQPAEGFDAPLAMDNGVGQQLQQLSAQLNDLQNQLNQKQAMPSQDSEPQPPAAPPPPAKPITVVLNNGQTVHVQDYAVMGNTLWDLSSQPVKKIPAASIDIPASIKATEATGIEFPEFSGGA
jgi:hypothetical protein